MSLLSDLGAITVAPYFKAYEQGMRKMHTQDTQPKQGSARKADRGIADHLRDLSRRLDMNAVANVESVRRELRSLADEGKLSAPPVSATTIEAPESRLRDLAQKEGWSNLNSMLSNLSAAEILQRLGHAAQAVPQAPTFDALTVPELDQFISEQIRFHSGIAEQERNRTGKNSKHSR